MMSPKLKHPKSHTSRLLYFLTLCIFPAFSLTAHAECIGVVTAGGGEDFWQHIENGALQAGKDNNYKVIVRGPINETDFKNQALIIDQMVAVGCKALVLAPNNENHIEKVDLLAQQGIPVVLMDRDLGGSRISAIRTENVHAGRLAGKEMANRLKEHGKVAVFRFEPKVSSTNDRESGFIEEIKNAGLEIILDEYIGTDITDASLKAYQLLTLHPEIDGLFTPNESTTLAAINMRRRLPQGDKIIHIGFDTHPVFIEEIGAGFLAAIVIQTPFHIGYMAVQHALDALKGHQPPEKLYTPSVLITQENIHTDKIKSTLAGR